MALGQPNLKIKVFSDGAKREDMLEMAKNPFVKGFTTNPTLMRKGGVTDYVSFCKDILTHIRDMPISFEVFADEIPEMRRQGLEIKEWGDNVYVKIPVTNSKGQPCAGLIEELAHSGVKLNVTAIFTLEQVEQVVNALRGGAPSVVSVFAGRIADTGKDPMPMMRKAADLCASADSNIELLWASPREVLNVYQAEEVGCKIITATPDIIKKLGTYGKDLSQFSLETVQMFKKDAEAAGYNI